MPEERPQARIEIARQALQEIDKLPPGPHAEMRLGLQANLGSLLCQVGSRDPPSRAEGLELLRGAVAAAADSAGAATAERLRLMLAQHLAGGSQEELSEAIELLEGIRERCSPQVAAEEYAGACFLLGYLHRTLPEQEDRRHNASAARCYEEALAVYTRESHPEQWARTSNNLAMAYRVLAEAGLGPGFDAAERRFLDALEVHTEEADPRSWRMTHKNLAQLYQVRSDGDPAHNRDRTIEHALEALEGRQPGEDPQTWYDLQLLLAAAFRSRSAAGASPVEDLFRAAHHEEGALVVVDPAADPGRWARHAHAAASLWLDLATAVRPGRPLLERGTALLAALADRIPREAAPDLFRRSHERLGHVFMNLPGPDRAADVERTITHFEAVLATPGLRESHPDSWARSHHNLGELISMRTGGDLGESRARTIEHLRLAQEVFTRQAFPRDWALAKSAEGAALARRGEGESEEDLEAAIGCLEAALEERTRDRDPRGWGRVKVNLAATLVARKRGDGEANLRIAEGHLEEAAQVLSRERTPDLWVALQGARGRLTAKTAGDDPEPLRRAAEILHDALATGREHIDPRMRIRLHEDAASVYRRLGERTGSAEDLLRAVEHQRECVQEDFPGRREESRSLHRISLATDLYRLGRNPPAEVARGSPEHLRLFEEGIAELEQALARLPPAVTEEKKALLLQVLGHLHFDHPAGRLEDWRRAQARYEEALALTGLERHPPDWAAALANLATAAQRILQHDPSADFSDRARERLERALRSPPEALEPRDLARLQSALADVLTLAGERQGDDQVQRAGSLYRQALATLRREPEAEAWLPVLHGLGLAYLDLTAGDRALHVERAIACLEAVDRHRGGRDAAVQHNLAKAYGSRVRGGPRENLERALGFARRSVRHYQGAGSAVELAGALEMLGILHHRRIEGDRSENLERAIEHLENALELLEEGGAALDRARIEHNLGAAYMERIAGAGWENTEQAIRRFESALAVRTREASPHHWAMTSANLGAALPRRRLGERRDNLLAAVRHLENAATVRSRAAHPGGWAEIQNGLGRAWADLGELGEAGARERAIGHYRAAIAATEGSFPELWAKLHVNLAATAQTAAERRAVRTELERVLEAVAGRTDPAVERLLLQWIGDLHFRLEEWAAALESYEAAIEIGRSVLSQAYTEAGRRSQASSTSRLYADSAMCLLRLGRLDEAFERLEEGKARILAEELGLDAELPARLDPGLGADLEAARRRLRELQQELGALDPGARAATATGETDGLDREPATGRGREQIGDDLRRARRQLGEVVARVQAALPDFLRDRLPLAQLLARCPEGGALVAPLVTSAGAVVLVVPAGVAAIDAGCVLELPQLTLEAQQHLLYGTDDEPGWIRGYVAGVEEGDRDTWRRIADDVTRRLWTGLLGPVHRRLGELGVAAGAPLLLLPPGGLGVMPLHAAWRRVDGERRALLDDYVVRYAPALRVLTERGGAGEGASLIVPDPTGSLAFAAGEVRVVAGLVGERARVLAPGASTPAAVLEAARGARHIHFACHAFHDWDVPLRSGIVLGEELVLTAAELSRSLDLNDCSLVTLAACESGLSEVTRASDEYVGLSASFLEAGVSAVVGSLWPVNDFSSMLVMERFYDGLRRGETVAAALRAAQLWLRDVTAGELAETVGEMRRRPAERRPISGRRAAALERGLARLDPAHPPYRPTAGWAAFVVAGRDIRMEGLTRP